MGVICKQCANYEPTYSKHENEVIRQTLSILAYKDVHRINCIMCDESQGDGHWGRDTCSKMCVCFFYD